MTGRKKAGDPPGVVAPARLTTHPQLPSKSEFRFRVVEGNSADGAALRAAMQTAVAKTTELFEAPTERPLADIFADVAVKRKNLDDLDDKLTSLIKRIEVALRRHFSTRISTNIETEDLEGSGEFESFTDLAFGKLDKRWQLLLVTGLVGEPQTFQTTALVSGTREERVRVFVEGHLERLVRDAGQELAAQIEQRVRAVKIGEELATVLDRAGGFVDLDETDGDS